MPEQGEQQRAGQDRERPEPLDAVEALLLCRIGQPDDVRRHRERPGDPFTPVNAGTEPTAAAAAAGIDQEPGTGS